MERLYRLAAAGLAAHSLRHALLAPTIALAAAGFPTRSPVGLVALGTERVGLAATGYTTLQFRWVLLAAVGVMAVSAPLGQVTPGAMEALERRHPLADQPSLMVAAAAAAREQPAERAALPEHAAALGVAMLTEVPAPLIEVAEAEAVAAMMPAQRVPEVLAAPAS